MHIFTQTLGWKNEYSVLLLIQVVFTDVLQHYTVTISGKKCMMCRSLMLLANSCGKKKNKTF